MDKRRDSNFKHALILQSTPEVSRALSQELTRFDKYPDDDTLHVMDFGGNLWIMLAHIGHLNHLCNWAKENNFEYEAERNDNNADNEERRIE